MPTYLIGLKLAGSFSASSESSGLGIDLLSFKLGSSSFPVGVCSPAVPARLAGVSVGMEYHDPDSKRLKDWISKSVILHQSVDETSIPLYTVTGKACLLGSISWITKIDLRRWKHSETIVPQILISEVFFSLFRICPGLIGRIQTFEQGDWLSTRFCATSCITKPLKDGIEGSHIFGYMCRALEVRQTLALELV